MKTDSQIERLYSPVEFERFLDRIESEEVHHCAYEVMFDDEIQCFRVREYAEARTAIGLRARIALRDFLSRI